MPKPCTVAVLAAMFCLGMWLISWSRYKNTVVLPRGAVEYDAVVVGTPTVHGKVLVFDMMTLGNRRLRVRASLLRDTIQNRWKGLQPGSGIHAVSVIEHGWHGRGYRTFIYYRNWAMQPVKFCRLSMMERVRLRAAIFRYRLLKRLSAAGLHDESYAVVSAMALGDKSGLSKSLRQTYSEVGASHVLALSGLHLGIIYFVLSLFVGFVRPKWLGESLILLTVWAFTVLVGMGASVLRSAIMVTLYSMARMTRRHGAGLNIVAFTAILMLMFSPQDLFDVGFQLSFLSVAGITVMYPTIFGLLKVEEWYKHPYLKRIWGMAVVAFCAQMATAPLVAYYFGTVSFYFLLTSFIVIPAATVIIYLTLAVLLLSFSPAASSIVATVLGSFVALEYRVLQLLSALPGSSVSGLHIGLLQVALAYIIIICLYSVLWLHETHPVALPKRKKEK